MKKSKQYLLGMLIAKREIEFANDDEVKKKIIIKIGKPLRDKVITDGYYCPYIILGIGSEKVKVAFGMDSIQAIELVFNSIGTILTTYYQPLYPGKITWNGESRLGFSLPDTPEGFIKKER